MQDLIGVSREQAIMHLATPRFRALEERLIALHLRLLEIHEAMRRLEGNYRREMRGFRLVLYVKVRKEWEHVLALYWAQFSGAPKEAFTADGKRTIRFKRHLPGRIKKCHIFKNAEASRQATVLECDRQAFHLNGAHHALMTALQSAQKRFESRGERRPWESQDLDIQAPELAPELPCRLHAAMGGAWRYFCRMAATEIDLEALCSSVQASPIHPHLELRFERDLYHPYGRARWHYRGYPLARTHGYGIQDHLTDLWMRRRGIPVGDRRLLAEIEHVRRRLIRDLGCYSEAQGDFQKKTAEALAKAERDLAAAGEGSQDVA